eukprot:357948-Chlamydomonas_euryale.AAC.2
MERRAACIGLRTLAPPGILRWEWRKHWCKASNGATCAVRNSARSWPVSIESCNVVKAAAGRKLRRRQCSSEQLSALLAWQGWSISNRMPMLPRAGF